MKKAAVVLCGSGFKDGSEIREAVGVLWALSKHTAEVRIFAPDEPQLDVVNCFTGKTVVGESRNQLVEAARIARGAVQPLTELRVQNHDFLVLPGGFGAAKNLCSFASEGSGGKVHGVLEKVVKEFFAQKKPLGAVCIAPAILALALKGQKLELTLGAPGEAALEMEKLGHRHIPKQANEWHVDTRHKIITTPAYMHESAPLHEIFVGIDGMVRELCALA